MWLIIFNPEERRVFIHQSTLVDRYDWQDSDCIILGELRDAYTGDDMRQMVVSMYMTTTDPITLVQFHNKVAGRYHSA